jgi:uncharacterized membrane protein YidH (DUF202 family)
LSWLDSGSHFVQLCVGRGDGAIQGEFVSSGVVQDLLCGSLTPGQHQSLVKAFKKGGRAQVAVTSQRVVFLLRSNPSIVIVWDSQVVMSLLDTVREDAFGSPSEMVQNATSTAMQFPYQVVRVVKFDGAESSKSFGELSQLFRHGLFISATRFDEFSTGIAYLKRDEVFPVQPAWMDELHKARDSDFIVGFRQSTTSHSSSWRVAHPMQVADDEGAMSEGAKRKKKRSAFRDGYIELSEDGAQVELHQERLRIAKDARTDPTVYWANERTWLHWLHIAIFLALQAVALLTFGSQGSLIAGLIMGPIALLVAVYSLVRSHLRNLAIYNSHRPDASLVGVVDWWGPWLIVPLVAIMLILITLFAFIG